MRQGNEETEFFLHCENKVQATLTIHGAYVLEIPTNGKIHEYSTVFMNIMNAVPPVAGDGGDTAALVTVGAQ